MIFLKSRMGAKPEDIYVPLRCVGMNQFTYVHFLQWAAEISAERIDLGSGEARKAQCLKTL